MKACWHCGCDWVGFPEGGGGGCRKGSVSPGPEVGIGGPETTGRGMAVEEVGEGGGRQVVEGFEGDE